MLAQRKQSYSYLFLLILVTVTTVTNIFYSCNKNKDYEEYQEAVKEGRDVGGPNWKP